MIANVATRREFLKTSGKLALAGLTAAPGLGALLAGCKTMEGATHAGAQLAVATGLVTASQADSLAKSTLAVARTFEDFTPEQEYYIGRTVGAMILQKYPPWNNSAANRYVNLVGQTLAKASDLPVTFGGYHFLIQDSPEINALAAPGGLIFVTRGMLRCCSHEEALAAVLAHEIGHVQSKHGLQSIKKSRVTSALTTIGLEGVKHMGSPELAQLTRTFEDSIADITATLINNGYSRSFERQADRTAVTILQRVGYPPTGLVDMLTLMGKRLEPGRLDFARTHPAPQDRIADLRPLIGGDRKAAAHPARQKRFQTYLGRV